MEGVEQRRQRLAAMGEEAVLQKDSGSLHFHPPLVAPLLPSNPLEKTGETVVAEVNGSGFDFYTDPLAGFSDPKRRRPALAALLTPSNAPQPPNAATHLHRGEVSHPLPLLQPATIFPLAPPAWQPVPYQPPPPFVPGYIHLQTPARYYKFPQQVPQFINQLPNQAIGRGYDSGRGYRDGCRSSRSGSSSGRGFGTGGTGYPSNVSGGHITPNSRGGRGSSWAGRSPQGSSWGAGNTSAGRGQRGARTVSAVEQPHRFFRKSMVEDPWRRLEASRVGSTSREMHTS